MLVDWKSPLKVCISVRKSEQLDRATSVGNVFFPSSSIIDPTYRVNMSETMSSNIALKASWPKCTVFVIVKRLHHTIKQKNWSCNQWRNIMEILKFPLSRYTMLQTHNIAWGSVYSLFLSNVKRGKGVETQNCPNSSFSHDFCHWLSEKISKIKCSILQLLVLHQIDGMQLSITSQFYNG